jgi:uncharacterized membrane protein YccC
MFSIIFFISFFIVQVSSKNKKQFFYVLFSFAGSIVFLRVLIHDPEVFLFGVIASGAVAYTEAMRYLFKN